MVRIHSVTATLLVALIGAAGCSESGIGRRLLAPEVEIVSPDENTVFRHGDGPVELTGLVFDTAQPAHTLEVRWTIDGEDEHAATADTGGFVPLSLDSESLTFGEHTATLFALDHDGEQGSANLTFIIAGPYTAPTVTITAPNDGSEYDTGEPITFAGEAVDSATPVEDLTFRWYADGEEMSGAVTADGQSIILWSDVIAGLRTIELQVTDSDGDVGADTVTVRLGGDVTSPQPGDVVFSEMNVNPEVVDDELGEWIELYNTSGRAVDISGYTFRDDDNDEYVLEGSLVVGAGDYFVLCAEVSPAVNGGVPCDGSFVRDWRGNGVALGNGEDELVLTRSDGVEIDWLRYDNSWYSAGAAIGVHPDHLDGSDNDDPSHWCPQTTVIATGGEPGTPGQENDPC
jgi:hypothetical protein